MSVFVRTFEPPVFALYVFGPRAQLKDARHAYLRRDVNPVLPFIHNPISLDLLSCGDLCQVWIAF
jgi:hypothetical protein